MRCYNRDPNLPDAIRDMGRVSIRPSEFIENTIKIPIGHELRFISHKKRPYYYDLMDKLLDRILLRCGRQVAKSTFMANMLWTRAALIPFTKVLYIAPTVLQAAQFSNDRLRTVLEFSELIGALEDKSHVQQVLHKALFTGSEIRLLYAFQSAGRTRGQTADTLVLDEIQDLDVNFIPVIQKVLFTVAAVGEEYDTPSRHAEIPSIEDGSGNRVERLIHNALEMHSGTPLTSDNTIDQEWRESTQNEWVIPCHHCGPSPKAKASALYTAGRTYNILGLDNVGREGPICGRCGGSISADQPDAHWRSMNPRPRNSLGAELLRPFAGFHVSQLMHPLGGSWRDLVAEIQTARPQIVYNEILGECYDSGSKPITRAKLLANCNPHVTMWEEHPQRRNGLKFFEKTCRARGSFLGLDHGQDTEASYTLITLGCYPAPGWPFTYFYFHRCVGEEVDVTNYVNLIHDLVERFNVNLIGSDAGGGAQANRRLLNAYGLRRVAKIQYGGVRLCTWNKEEQHYSVNRHAAMGHMFDALRDGDKLVLPCADEFEHPFADDVMNIFGEHDERRNMTLYGKPKGLPDDTFHSMLYCFLAASLRYPRDDVWGARLDVDDAPPRHEGW